MKNSFILGAIFGIIAPLAAFILTQNTDIVQQTMPTKPTGLYVIAGGINLIAVWICYRNHLEQLGKGIVLITFLCMLALVFTKTISI